MSCAVSQIGRSYARVEPSGGERGGRGDRNAAGNTGRDRWAAVRSRTALAHQHITATACCKLIDAAVRQ